MVLQKKNQQKLYFIVNPYLLVISLSLSLSRNQRWQPFRIPITSNPIQLKDTTDRIARMRPSQIINIEDKSWPPLEIVNNHHQPKFKRLLSVNVTAKTCSPQAERSTSVTEYLSNSIDQPNYNYSSSSLKLEFEPPFRIKVTLGFRV